MVASIIAVGNPGAGKSTILNSLAGELLFKSGVSFGAGLTDGLDIQQNSRGRFYDTPGLSDDTLREAAAKAITTALREGGDYKILFFVRLEAGRIVREDITTFKLVLKSAPEIGKKYGIVTNKLPLNVAKLLQDPNKAAKLLTHLFANIPEENRCALSSVTYLTYRSDADSVDNYLLNLDDLKTLEGSCFADFVYGQVETVRLTRGKANDIEVEDYDKTTRLIEILHQRMEADRQMLMEQQRRMLEQAEKAENEREKFYEIEKERFNEKLEFMSKQMEQKDLEVQQRKLQNQQLKHQKEQKLEFLSKQVEQKEKEKEDAKNDLEVQQLKLQYQQLTHQKEQNELATYRERTRQKLEKKNSNNCKVQ